MSSSMRLLGGGSGLSQVVSDMNANILEYNAKHANKTFDEIKSNTVTGTAIAGSTTTVPVAHGLTYIPKTDVWYRPVAGTTYTPLPALLEGTVATGYTFKGLFSFTVDATNLIITMQLGSTSLLAGDYSFKYTFYKATTNTV